MFPQDLDNASTHPEQRLKKMPTRGSACYVLGAGFSAAMRRACPTSHGFFRRQLDYHGLDPATPTTSSTLSYDVGRRDSKGLLDRIEARFGPIEDLDLEEVMTDLHVRAHGVGRSWEDQKPNPANAISVQELQRDYEALLDYIVVRLRVAGDAPDHNDLPARFVQSLKTQDSVLTLNYDTVVEQALLSYGGQDGERRLNDLERTLGRSTGGQGGLPTPPFVDPKRQEFGVFVKLHGSLDWVACENRNCPNHADIGRLSTSLVQQPFRDRDARCDSCGWSMRTVIIPPISAKAFEEFPKLGRLWSMSYHALCRSFRWVFLGVSFAFNDFHLAPLIRSASRNAMYFEKDSGHKGQFCVVDRDLGSAKDVAKRLSERLASGCRNWIQKAPWGIVPFSSIEEYLDAAKASDAERGDVTDH